MKNIYLLLILALFVFISCQNEEKASLCAVLDSVYNVSRLYEVKNVDEILNMMKNNK